MTCPGHWEAHGARLDQFFITTSEGKKITHWEQQSQARHVNRCTIWILHLPVLNINFYSIAGRYRPLEGGKKVWKRCMDRAICSTNCGKWKPKRNGWLSCARLKVALSDTAIHAGVAWVDYRRRDVMEGTSDWRRVLLTMSGGPHFCCEYPGSNQATSVCEWDDGLLCAMNFSIENGPIDFFDDFSVHEQNVY